MPLAARILLTYLVHSSLLLGAAAIACGSLRARCLALQEALLRAALVGGLVTTTLQIGLALEPAAGRLQLEGPLPAAASGSPVLAPQVPSESGRVPGPAAAPAAASVAPSAVVASTIVGAARRTAPSWRTILVLGWAVLALLGGVRLIVAGARLHGLLRGRSRSATAALAEAASAVAGRLGIQRPVPLSAAPRLAVPLATGLLRPEVCLPTRALAEMDRDQQLALCAHELAHVARRDPAWILLARGVEALAPLQPLNTWARRRLQDLAECLSDDLAVSASVRPLGLARSLLDVASWTIGDDTVLPVTAAGALTRRSRLGHRVERLMDPLRTPERQNRLFLPTAALVVLASALVTPVVAGDGAPPTPEAPETPPAYEAVPPPEAPAPPEAPEVPVTVAPPAPAAAPRPARPPRPHPAPRAQGDAQTTLAALSTQIEARARQHEAELSRLQSEIEALAARFTPDEAELARLGDEIGKAAEDVAQAALDGIAGEKSERAQAAARRLAELETKLQALTSELRVPKEQIEALAEKARALAEASRPSEEELRELRRLSRELARQARPDSAELALMRKEAREQARVAAERAREAMRHADEELRRAREEMRRVHEEARRAREEARRDRAQDQQQKKTERDALEQRKTEQP